MVYGLLCVGHGLWIIFQSGFWILHSGKIGVWDSGKVQIIAGVIQFETRGYSAIGGFGFSILDLSYMVSGFYSKVCDRVQRCERCDCKSHPHPTGVTRS